MSIFPKFMKRVSPRIGGLAASTPSALATVLEFFNHEVISYLYRISKYIDGY